MDGSSHRTGSQRTTVLEERARLDDQSQRRHSLRTGSRGQLTSPYRVVLSPAGRGNRSRAGQALRLRYEERNGRGASTDEDVHREGPSATRCGRPDAFGTGDDALSLSNVTSARRPAIASCRWALSRLTRRSACD